MRFMEREMYLAYDGRDLAALQKYAQRVDTLFEAIAHGDEPHRTWLKEAIRNHLAGKPVQPKENP